MFSSWVSNDESATRPNLGLVFDYLETSNRLNLASLGLLSTALLTELYSRCPFPQKYLRTYFQLEVHFFLPFIQATYLGLPIGFSSLPRRHLSNRCVICDLALSRAFALNAIITRKVVRIATNIFRIRKSVHTERHCKPTFKLFSKP